MHQIPAVILVSASLCTVGAVAQPQSRYDNPVDKKSYVTSGEFKTYAPAVPKDTRGQRVTTAGVLLLTGEPELKARISVQDLAEFLKTVEARAATELGRNKSAMAALVQFNCQPGKCDVKLMSQGQAEESILQALYEALARLPPLKTSGEVIFQVEFRVGA